MKPFFEVILLAASILLFAFNQIGLAIFASMFTVILWMWPENKGQSVEQIISEANGDFSEGVHVVYSFCSEKSETFSADLHYYNNKLDKNKVLEKLAEYVTYHTGMHVDPERLHIVSMKPFCKEAL